MEKEQQALDHWMKRQFPQLPAKGIKEVLKLHAEGNPIPYIAYFYKDQTEQIKSKEIHQILKAKDEWDEMEKRQKYILKEIEAQGKLDDELKLSIERCADLDRLEDFYAPFKLKKQALAAQAREAGLEPLAKYVWNKAHGYECEEIPGDTILEKAAAFAKPDTKFANAESVCKGVQDILIEKIAENAELRSTVRAAVLRRSKLQCSKGTKAKQNSRYSKFFDYQEPVGALKKSNAAHRYLTIRKGWMEDELSLSFERPDEGVLLEKFEEFACPVKDSVGAELALNAARLALKGNVYTVMENETHRYLKESAEKNLTEHLIEVLTKKLMRPGFGRKAVMGVDPGMANSAVSVVLLDSQGKYLVHNAFKPEDFETTKAEILKTISTLKIEAIALAHGPRSKEIRDFWQKFLQEAGISIPVVGIHEHSSSIYASSSAAKEEFPDLDVNTRRAIFVARFLQNPLATLTRLDTKYLSLGEFQHEVNGQYLRKEINHAIEGIVNFVGVDVNLDPVHMLAKVAGIHSDLAKAIVVHRETKGAFTTKKDLLQVDGMNEKIFTFAAAFLRVHDGAEILDSTAIHPKHYAAIKDFAQSNGITLASFTAADEEKLLTNEELKKEIGETNLKNIAYELIGRNQDPRGTYEVFHYNPAIKTSADLQKEVPYSGVITNITNFGAFVDVGVEQDGLVHISEIKDINSIFPGDAITVWVSQVNMEKKQISFTVKDPRARAPRAAQRPRTARPPRPARGEVKAANPDASQQQAPYPPREQREYRERGPRRDTRGGERKPQDKAASGATEKEKRAPKKPHRDPKTGAIVKLDDTLGGKRDRDAPRVASKAKPHTFNPFANLGNIMKDKIAKE